MNATTTVATILLNSSMTVSTLSAIAPAVVATTATSTFATPLFSHRNFHHGFSKSNKPHIKDFSPVTLSTEWPSMARLLVLACLSVIGSIGNVFMISSVMIEDHLKKAGNAFIVSVALADLLVSSVLIPTSVIVLLAGFDESSMAVCRVQWFFASCAFLVTILSLALTAFENHLRLCTPQDSPSWFNRSNTTTIMLIVWFVASAASGVQYTSNIGFDFCQRKWIGMLPYQMAIVAMLIILPLVVTFYIHMRIILDVKRLMSAPNFKPHGLKFTWDLALARTNFYSFIIFVAFWLPFGIVLSYHTTADVTKRSFYATAWIGFVKSCFHNVIYCITNRHFRNAYVNLFHYCCCKITVNNVSRRQRTEACRPTSDVRVHIIPGYNMYSYTSPQRSGNCHNYWNKRDVHEL